MTFGFIKGKLSFWNYLLFMFGFEANPRVAQCSPSFLGLKAGKKSEDMMRRR